MYKVLKNWIPLAVGLTCLFLVGAMIPQTIYRELADDPQVQISKDIAEVLKEGEDPSSLDQQSKVDLANSLSTFVAVFDKDAKLLASNATLNNEAPKIPEDAVKSADKGGQNRVTWQPQNGVRHALVITKYDGPNPGYVAVGRSLKETESRTKDAFQKIAILWIITLALTFLATWMLRRKRPEHTPEKPETTPQPQTQD